jgi:ABC-2 type transport system ATP-binding protein
MHITVRGLTKTYRAGVTALRDVDLDVPGGMFGLLGANGAGKTTLMRILAGVLRPTAGEVRVGGHDMATESGRVAVKRVLGYLPQELGVYPDLTARGFLDYLAILKGLDDRRTRRARVAELIDTVGLEEAAARKLKTFSGGMKRRVGIAQALLNDPALLIVDEPTAGLDPEERIRFRSLLSRLAGERTIILSTHIVEDVAASCRRLAVLVAGHLVFTGSTAALMQRADGRVWTLNTSGQVPEGDLTVVSALHLGDATLYRMVGERPAGTCAEPAAPSLEDGYVALMRAQRDGAKVPLDPAEEP